MWEPSNYSNQLQLQLNIKTALLFDNYKLPIAMMKFQEQEIVWAEHPHHQMQWPAKITRILTKNGIQIVFYHSNQQKKEAFIVDEDQCKHFDECRINSKDSPLLLYEAYKLANKEYIKSKQAKEVSFNGASLATVEWGTQQLRKQIDVLLVRIPKPMEIERLMNGISRMKLKPNEARTYFKERFCQKLAYLVREESEIDRQLKYALNQLRLNMKIMLLQAFKVGDL